MTLARLLCVAPLLYVAALPLACQPAGVRMAEHGGLPANGGGNDSQGGADTDEPPTATAPVAAGLTGGPGGHYTMVGRFDVSLTDRLTFSFANSKVGARFVGTSVAVWLSTSGDDAYDVVVDTSAPMVITPTNDGNRQRIVVATGLPERSHTVWLTKRTEGYATANDGSNSHTGTGVFYGFDIGEGRFLSPPGTQPVLIEAIGDSAFTGYGAMATIMANGNDCVFTPATENASFSTPAHLAEALQAEVINISAAGKGVASSVYNTDPNAQLPSVYLRTVQPNDAPSWPFNDPPVAAVVIQAGANDLAGSYGSGYFPSHARFVTAYTNLLATVRSHRPNAAIVCVVTSAAAGSDPNTLRDAYQEAIDARKASGDSNLYTFGYFDGDPDNSSYNDIKPTFGAGCEGHPSDAGARFLAGRLATFLRTVATFP